MLDSDETSSQAANHQSRNLVVKRQDAEYCHPYVLCISKQNHSAAKLRNESGLLRVQTKIPDSVQILRHHLGYTDTIQTRITLPRACEPARHLTCVSSRVHACASVKQIDDASEKYHHALNLAGVMILES